MRFTLPKSLEAKSYEKQRELNKAFHRYTTNYSVSFNGPNNAEHQIGTSAIDKGNSVNNKAQPIQTC